MDHEVQESLEALCGGVVSIDPEDPASLAELHGLVGRLGELTGAEDANVAAVLTLAGQWLEQLIYEEAEDVDQTVEQLNQMVSDLQQALRSEGEVGATLGHWLGQSESAAERGELPPPLPANVDQGILDGFLSRQSGVLEEIEAATLEVERGTDPEQADRLRRLIHTLKGEAGLLGMQDVAAICHALESAMDAGAADTVIEPLLKAKDHFALVFEAYSRQTPLPVMPPVLRTLIDGEVEQDDAEPKRATADDQPRSEAPREVIPPEEIGDAGTVVNEPELLAEFVQESRDHLDQADDQLLQLQGAADQPDALNAVFRAFHTIKGVAGFLQLKAIKHLAHTAETLLDRARCGELTLADGRLDAALDATGLLRKMIEEAGASEPGQTLCWPEKLTPLLMRLSRAADGEDVPADAEACAVEANERLGSVLVEIGALTRDELAAAMAEQAGDTQVEPLGQILLRKGLVTSHQLASALRAQQRARKPAAAPDAAAAAAAPAPSTASQPRRTPRRNAAVRDVIKVDADRLDSLINAIGELAIADAMVAQSSDVQEEPDSELSRRLRHMHKVTRSLQDLAMSLRMVPLNSTFQKMARLARDVAVKLGKPIDFSTAGEDTELDKTVADKIGDPLIHMIRNAVDHGLEASPEERRAVGKPDAGRVELRASYEAGHVVIQVRDDGRGLDREAILAKARDRGLVGEDENLSDDQVHNLIFAPGFSTAAQLTDVSGRGVGLDVVRKAVEALRGRIEIATKLGEGTTFTFRLPLTLAVIDGMVLSIGGHRFIAPCISLTRMVHLDPKSLRSVLSRAELISHGGGLVPVLRGRDVFGVDDQAEKSDQSVIAMVESGGRAVGLVAEQLLGQQQVVIKSLGASGLRTPGIAGGAIMPDGRVGLVLDPQSLVQFACGSGREAA